MVVSISTKVDEAFCSAARGTTMASGRPLTMATQPPRPRLPEWFRTTLPSGDAMEAFRATKAAVKDNALHTVCEEARCPNVHDCWSSGDATYMIAGQECTRGCRFCAVGTIKRAPPLDPEEPQHLAEAVASMPLRHAVITVVNRDDLADSGAAHYRACLDAVAQRCPEVTLELLCSDLAGDLDALAMLLDGAPLRVFAHNVECVPRLDRTVRDHRASFEQSLAVLREARRLRPDLLIKTSIMVGLGERDEEILEAMAMVREAGVDLITLGQYLAPSAAHLPVDRYPEPAMFHTWADQAIGLGFLGVASGPLVRSSFKAGLLLRACTEKDWDGEMPGATVRVRRGAAADRHPHRSTSGGEA